MQVFLNELMTAVAILTLTIITMLIKSATDYLKSQRKEIQSKVKSEKIKSINKQVQDNVELAFQSFIVNSNLIGPDGKIKDGYLQQMQQSAVLSIVKSVREITNEGIIDYVTNEHIHDFDKWIASQVEILIQDFESRYK